MDNLKSIICYDENGIIWEGKVLMQQENYFEGIIDSSCRNTYVYGNINVTDLSIHITKIAPEDYPFYVENYIAFLEKDFHRYFGEAVDTEGNKKICFISIKNLNISRQILGSQIEEFRFILEQHKETMHQRYNQHLRDATKTYDDNKVAIIEAKLRKKGKLNYYL